MVRYEALMLAVPEVTQDEAKNIESLISSVVSESGGSMITFDRWGKYRLAYPVQKNEYGVYYLARFDVEDVQKAIKGLSSLFTIKVNNVVMRHVLTALDSDASLLYQRPQSLEETPARDVNSFIRENKMDGIMSAAQRRSGAHDDVTDIEEIVEGMDTEDDND